MRTQRSLSVLPVSGLLAACCLALLPALTAQEPKPAPTPTPTPATQPQDPAATTTPPPAGEGRRGGRPRRAPVVIEAGTVHPVAGAPIDNGIVVIRGERIVAVGKKGEVEVPPNATVHSFPTGHVYPGLVDAATDAFTDDTLRNDGGNDGGSRFADDLRVQGNRNDALAAAGITTAYVTVRSPALVRGKGAIVRPTKDGFEAWTGKDAAALHLRMTNGVGPSHALQRQQQVAQIDALFEGLDEFRKQLNDHDEAVKKYDKEFADYLAWHQKKKDGDKPAGGGAERAANPAPAPAGAGGPAGPGPAREGRPNRGRPGPGGGGGGGEPPKNDPPKSSDEQVSPEQLEQALATLLAALPQDPPKPVPTPAPAPAPGAQDPAKPAEGAPGQGPAAATEKKDEAPKRPTYPKAPPRDLQREALLAVIDGELPLRVEAHRADEVRGALKLGRDRQIPVLVLEQAFGADACAAEIAKAGVAVVLTDTMAAPFEPPYDTMNPAKVPAKLHAAGVPFALASGRAHLASLLPLLAATAVGNGLPADAALRAITLTPAEILGVAQDTGSLQPGKYGDIVVTDRPLFATDSRILMVLGKGRTEFEAK